MLQCQKRLQQCHNGGHLLQGTVWEVLSIFNRRIVSFHGICMKLICLPFPLTKKGLLCCFHSTYCPRPSSVCCMTFNCTFIDKNKLVGFICSNSSCKYGSLLRTPFECCVGELRVGFIRYTCTKIQLHTFFMLYPPFTKVLHIVDIATDTPCLSSSSRHSLSKYTSSVLFSVL